MTEKSQQLHFRKYNLWWSLNARRVKRTARSRLRWGEEFWGRHVDQCCLFVWVYEETAKQAGVPWSVFGHGKVFGSFFPPFSKPSPGPVLGILFFSNPGDRPNAGKHDGGIHQWAHQCRMSNFFSVPEMAHCCFSLSYPTFENPWAWLIPGTTLKIWRHCCWRSPRPSRLRWQQFGKTTWAGPLPKETSEGPAPKKRVLMLTKLRTLVAKTWVARLVQSFAYSIALIFSKNFSVSGETRRRKIPSRHLQPQP